METLKVLHITPRPLPDIRVERAILSDHYMGNEVYLAAPDITGRAIREIPLGFYKLKFTLFDKAGYRRSRGKLKKIVQRVKPDVIHAHDFPSAYLSKGLAPMVYDSHEDRVSTAYIRAKVKLKTLLGPLSSLLEFIPKKYYRKNVEVIEDVVVVAPSNKIVEKYLKFGARKGFELPNFPHKLEVPKIEPGIEEETIHGAVDRPQYIVHGHKFPHRRPVDGFPKKFEEGRYGKLFFVGGNIGDYKNVTRHEFVPHMRLYEMFKDVRTLLVPRKPHPLHEGISPNRVYTLIQVGAVPVIPRTLTQVIKYVPEAITFYDDEEFRDILEGIANEDSDNRIRKKRRVYEVAKRVRRLDEVQREAYKYARSGKCLFIIALRRPSSPHLIILLMISPTKIASS